ncbi:hypothetical protein DL93DRAFT_2129722 [Clavulina sp. PMI_390]|nr:hypothetical protein DL93DRAFT_2129722 [Clavulina sp. PMI_390]
MRFSSTLGLFALLSVASAHFTLDYPYTRGFDEDSEPDVPCGGFSVNKTRTPFPLSGGFVSFSSFHNTASSVLGVSFSSDPQSLSDFNTTTSGQAYGLLTPTFSTTVEGSFCVHVNISSLGVSDAKNGVNATILMVYNGGDGTLHQCSDVTLLSNYTIPSSIPCTDAGTITGGSTSGSGPTSTSGGSPSSTASSSPSSTSSKSAAMTLTIPSAFAGVLALVGALLM